MIASHLPLKEIVEVRLNGVMVIIFCLYEQAGQACWFDSVRCSLFSLHIIVTVTVTSLETLFIFFIYF